MMIGSITQKINAANEFVNNSRKEIIAAIAFFLTYLPTLIWMWDRWFARDSYYSHGILIPFVVGFLIWQKKEELKKIKSEKSVWGMRLIIAGVVIHIISSVFRIYFSSGFSMLIVLVGLILYFYGEKIFSKILFPIAFLFFMVPVPMVVIADISFKMKILAAQLATLILNNIRIPAIRDGSLIKMQHTYVVVEDVCSGLRSLISLMALGSIFAYWMTSKMVKKILLFLSTIPIAIITNVCRIVFLSSVSEIWGSQYAVGFLHDLSGFMVFALAFVLLFAVGKLLE